MRSALEMLSSRDLQTGRSTREIHSREQRKNPCRRKGRRQERDVKKSRLSDRWQESGGQEQMRVEAGMKDSAWDGEDSCDPSKPTSITFPVFV